MNTEERILRVVQGAKLRVLKGNSKYGTVLGGGQIGFTHISLALDLLKSYKVTRVVPDMIHYITNAQTGEVREIRQAPEAQNVWCLSTGIPGDFFYGNTFEECLAKAEQHYKRWMPEVLPEV